MSTKEVIKEKKAPTNIIEVFDLIHEFVHGEGHLIVFTNYKERPDLFETYQKLIKIIMDNIVEIKELNS